MMVYQPFPRLNYEHIQDYFFGRIDLFILISNIHFNFQRRDMMQNGLHSTAVSKVYCSPSLQRKIR